MGLPYGEEIMIVGRTMWTQSTSVTDGQTDGRTELRSQRPCNAERRTVKKGEVCLTYYVEMWTFHSPVAWERSEYCRGRGRA